MKNRLPRSLSPPFSINLDFAAVLLLVGIWLSMILLVNPIGDFPLDDDWAYGWTVKTLLETGEYQLSDWTATNLLPQALWGTLFCLPFGFSFTALRISTLVLGLAGVLATYGVLRTVNESVMLALLGTAIVGFNPIYSGLANSFNSDVPSFTFSIVSLYLIILGLKQNSKLVILSGILFSLISVLNRQSGIVILVAFGFAFLVRQGIKLRTIVIAVSPTLLGLLLQAAYSHWLNSTGKTPVLYGFQIKNLAETFAAGGVTIASTYLENAVILSAYLGLFLFSFLVVCFANRFTALSPPARRWQIFAVLLLTLGIVLVLKSRQMPFVGNTLATFGLGPEAFSGYSDDLSAATKALFNRVWELLTLAGFVGVAFLLLFLGSALLVAIDRRPQADPDQKWLLVLAGSAAMLYLALIAGLNKQYWFDRYLLFPLPLLIVIAAVLGGKAVDKNRFGRNLPSGAAIAAIVMLFLSGSFTVTATHDYLAWNRARWQALNDLTVQTSVLPEQIYGGFEFNGWHFGNRLETCNPDYARGSTGKPSTIDAIGWGTFDCLWGENTATFQYSYRLSFVDQPGYLRHRSYQFQRWLPWKNQNLYVLRKT